MASVPLTKFNPSNIVNYITLRELGQHSVRKRQATSSLLTSRRLLGPVIADSPSECRSTYLVRLNSSNTLLAAAHGDRSVSIYDPLSGELVGKCTGHERSPWTIVFHSSQPYLLASGCLAGSIRLWNLECLANIDIVSHGTIEITSSQVWKHSGAIASLSFHPAHPVLAAAWTQEVVFYDWMSGRKLAVWRFVSNQSRVRWVRFNPDGSLLYTATANPSTICSFSENRLTFAENNNDSEELVALNGSVQIDCPGQQREDPPTALAASTPSFVSRSSLLEFLVSQPDCWFNRLGICDACSIRLCQWAGSLGPEFPSRKVNIQRSIATVTRVAERIAGQMRLADHPLSRIVRELLDNCHSSEASQNVNLDATPAAVAIIEDIPVREFLLSRGNYCSKPSVVIAKKGLCCGGHACDLVVTHRGLMRHSMCRQCLASFWRWASGFVNWWCWEGTPLDLAPECLDVSPSHDIVLCPSNDVEQFLMTHGDDMCTASVDSGNPVVGLCIQCQASITNDSTLARREDSTSIRDASPNSREGIGGSHSIPLAALELVRSRLSNANEVTPITFMAPDLIMKGTVDDYLHELVRTEMPPSQSVPRNVRDFVRSLETAYTSSLYGSPLLKRRKMDSCSLPGTVIPECSRCTCQAFSVNTVHPYLDAGYAQNDSSSPCVDIESFIAEAAELGRLMSSYMPNAWNYPRRVHLVPSSTDIHNVHPSLNLFTYAPLGARLLCPTACTTTTSLSSRSSANLASDCSVFHGPSLFDSRSETDDKIAYDTGNRARLMTACCRCGRIVPQAFPIDPQSTLSAVVCEKLVLSDDHCTSNVLGDDLYSRHSNSLHPFEQHSPTLSPRATRSSTPVASSGNASNQSNLMYLINRTNPDSMLNAMHRGITEAIAGLLVDMGEHGSASCLQDTTYRVCCWELNFSGPIQKTTKYGCCMLPMPANVAVSYNTNSLIIPHARLFNDSSICLSPDGRTLAAFVIPATDHDRLVDSGVSGGCSPLKTVLAVFRLQPKLQRGHCLFAQRFNTFHPVCLDFSPLGDYLAVGLATTRIPSASPLNGLSANATDSRTQHRNLFGSISLSSGNSDNASVDVCALSSRPVHVAQIFHLKRLVQNLCDNGAKSVSHALCDVVAVKHPLLLNPVSCSRQRMADGSDLNTVVDTLDRWHRLLLSSPSGISLNTIIWSPNGGLFYGTTKGLVILMKIQPTSLCPSLNSILDDAFSKYLSKTTQASSNSYASTAAQPSLVNSGDMSRRIVSQPH